MKEKILHLFIMLLFSALASAQYTGTTTYNFTDGTIISAGESADGNLVLGGTYSLHGSTYGLNMKADGTIALTVTGSNTIRFLGSQHSGLDMTGSAAEVGDLGTQSTKVENDLSDTFDFVYGGIISASETIDFTLATGTGGDLYLPSVEVIPGQAGKDFTTADENIIYYFDFRDESIIPSTTPGNVDVSMGLIDVLVGTQNAYGYNGTQHGCAFKPGNQIVLDVAGNSYIKVGGSIYSGGDISISSTTGDFDISSQAAKTSANFDADGSSVDFLYVGTAGTVTLDFSSTAYVPYIEIVPVPYDVALDAYVQKSGTITINGVEISYTAGADAATSPTVTVSEGVVVSATTDMASIYIDLAGNALSSYSPTLTGDIASVDLSNDETIEITLADDATDPKSYSIKVVDTSIEANPEAGKLYTYSFTDGSELPQISYTSLRYATFFTSDRLVTINSNTTDEALQFGFHDGSHGAVMFSGNSMDIKVAGNAIVSIVSCRYGGATDAVWEFTDAIGTVLGSIQAKNNDSEDGYVYDFIYEGEAGVLTATLKSESYPDSEIYVHGFSVENAVAATDLEGKTAVWDFGGEQLDETTYINRLNADVINAWYGEDIIAGSSGNLMPNFTAEELSFVGGGNDRLRTSNTALTRYDENSGSSVFDGRVYINSSAATGRYISLSLSEDDEVDVVALSQNGQGLLNFVYVADPSVQTDAVSLTTEAEEYSFVAKQEGVYRIYDTQDKPSYYRVYRTNAAYVTVNGDVDITNAADIPSGYSIVFTNEAGKTWSVVPSDDSYSIDVPSGYSYSLSLADANGYVITTSTSLEVSGSVTNDIIIETVELNTLSGNVTGLGDALADVTIAFKPVDETKIYMPEVTLDNSTGAYSVLLEPNVEYIVSGGGVNDYEIQSNSVTITADESGDIVFTAKPVYAVTVNATNSTTGQGLTEDQLSALTLVFSNLEEEGYTYSFGSLDEIELRDGTYAVSYEGIDAYDIKMKLTSNLTIDGGAASKELVFERVTEWLFDDRDISSATAYNGLTFTGSVNVRGSSGDLTVGSGATITIPVKVGEKVIVTDYYQSNYSIEGGETIANTSGSTGTNVIGEYVYEGTTDGTVTLTTGGTCYFISIEVVEVVAYAAEISVGTDKDYQTINDALDAIALMDRPNSERVTVMIDPGNYEEMLVIDLDNISLVNASLSPSIALANKGVDIDANAVRITSYYGHGYNYYSMGVDQKWDEEELGVNKANGYLSYENAGSGTTNGSFWNATVVVYANGFEAENIIFENSFNQYISQKEANDVVVEWTSGGKGTRPTTYGSTDVQAKSYIERAAALAINGGDKMILNNCRLVGRQDVLYGGQNCRVVAYKGNMMGGTDYIFGGMTAVFYKTDIALNTSEDGSDIAYITAGQQADGVRGYLMYECNITSAEPGVDNAASYRSKPGYFGRCWSGSACEVIFYNTNIETSNNPSYSGESLIAAAGWMDGLGGPSWRVGEYGTTEESGVDNSSSRVSGDEVAGDWGVTVLTSPVTRRDGEDITTYNFTKGDDEWDPIPELIANDASSPVRKSVAQSSVTVYSMNNQVVIEGISGNTVVRVYSLDGKLVKTVKVNENVSFYMPAGYWVVNVTDVNSSISQKVSTF